MEGGYCYFAKHLLLWILQAHNDHVLPQENNIAVTAKWPWVLHITCLSMYTLLVTVFSISLVLLLLGRTIVIQKRGTYGTTIVTMMEEWLHITEATIPTKSFPITILVRWYLSRSLSLRQISGDLPLPKFWLLAISQSLSSYLWIYLQAYNLYLNWDKFISSKTLPEWGRFPDGITLSMKNCHGELQIYHLAFSYRSSGHYLSLP